MSYGARRVTECGAVQAVARRKSPGTGPGLVWTRLPNDGVRSLDVVAERQVRGGRDRDRAEPTGRGALRGARLPPALPLGPSRGWIARREQLPEALVRGLREETGLEVEVQRSSPRTFALPRLDVPTSAGHRWHRAPLGRDAPLAVVPPGSAPAGWTRTPCASSGWPWHPAPTGSPRRERERFPHAPLGLGSVRAPAPAGSGRLDLGPGGTAVLLESRWPSWRSRAAPLGAGRRPGRRLSPSSPSGRGPGP